MASARELERFLQSLGRALTDAAAAASDAATASGVGHLAAITRSVAASVSARAAEGSERLPVCRFWDRALDDARQAGTSLADSLDALAASLSWTQNPNYRRQPPDAGFLDHYGYAVIVGPAEGPPALAVDPRAAIGVLLLGPPTHYPLHSHPAVEVYYTLTREGEWWRGSGPWRSEPAGAAIYHAPTIPHATRTGDAPLLAIYVWTGDLATHASLRPSRE